MARGRWMAGAVALAILGGCDLSFSGEQADVTGAADDGKSDGNETGCAESQTDCWGQCRDLASDSENCGWCGVVCDGGRACQDGACACPGDQTDCWGQCKALGGDSDNCGWCGNVCGGGRACLDGVCACPDGQTDCWGECRDLQSDSANCGWCDLACEAGRACQAGACACPEDQTDCWGQCLDLGADPNNCGWCGNACGEDLVCKDGACVCPDGLTDCWNRCLDLGADPNNCGWCGLACAKGEVCRDGQCAPSDCVSPCPELGTAAAFAVLGLGSSRSGDTAGTLQNSLVTIVGAEGVGYRGKIVNMAPSVVDGTVYEFADGQYSGPGKLTGSIEVDPARLDQAYDDALAASRLAASLPPTQSLRSIDKPTTVLGNGGLNVIAISGNVTKSLTLQGGAADVFVVNVAGTVSLGGSDVLGIAGGVTADHVLYNFTSAGKTISTHVGNAVYGTLLANENSFHLDGTFDGAVIGGKNISMLSGAVVRGVPFGCRAMCEPKPER